ncbi:May24p CYBJADRAFT_192096 [Cyberlindnera jadinii NRRL Y-1542]|uniref:Integral membrane protein n=1 Tax=Cyberlindnera jadinii (strain ATCC 18201 / CBS 1600 / BCRC 20928 / JCM 3617 / NBRC 0987 / NRRL Y-1542) TaxID=983966 RepID=A0A1E4RVR0_CYBJN|nr:hypothetical protein CYBJADRAFT_192096 [Cyberlindnera jadinii NRRL Y-1542]ODV71336.1 hypothetical protein CYBJADRAFT_192096 [Cyberlindnera jadinii NRRL Y-1542]
MSSTYITIADVPVGYTVPPFPSLYWPLHSEQYQVSYLYYLEDMWRFTVIWTVIFFSTFYGAAGVWAAFLHRKIANTVWILVVYLAVGSLQGFVSGTIFSLVLGAIYNAGVFAMSTWIPMCAGVVQILFVVIASYSLTAGIL